MVGLDTWFKPPASAAAPGDNYWKVPAFGPRNPIPANVLGPGNLGQTIFGSLKIPGYAPDWGKLAQGDPNLALLKGYAGQDTQLDQSRLKELIDTLTGRTNTNIGEINRQEGLDERASGAGLNGAGFGNSSQVGFAAGNIRHGADVSIQNARNALLDAVKSAQQQFSDAQTARQRQIDAATQTATANAQQANPAVANQTAALMRGWLSADGGPVYRTPDGRYFNRNGQPTVPRFQG